MDNTVHILTSCTFAKKQKKKIRLATGECKRTKKRKEKKKKKETKGDSPIPSCQNQGKTASSWCCPSFTGRGSCYGSYRLKASSFSWVLGRSWVGTAMSTCGAVAEMAAPFCWLRKISKIPSSLSFFSLHFLFSFSFSFVTIV